VGYNELAHPDDRVYILGDVAFTRRALNASVPRLNGRKVLVKGNHDVDKLSYYAQHFDDVRSYVVKKGFVLSHIPLHPDCLGRWNLNIHGHLHGNHIMLDKERDSRYRNVCVEQTSFRPILLDQVLHEEGLK
jgi:calcineurin-like phosphoesterase family protein